MLSLIKSVFWIGILVIALRWTGAAGHLSEFVQSNLIKTGIMNANAERSKERPNFDFNFIVKDIRGNHVPFETYRGKVIFLNLWATWCGPCRAEMPSIQKLFDSNKNEDIAFVALSLDKDRDKEKIMSFITNRQFTFPIFQPSGNLTEQLQVPSIPTTFIIDKEGKIVSKEVGATNFNTSKFKKFLEKLATQP